MSDLALNPITGEFDLVSEPSDFDEFITAGETVTGNVAVALDSLGQIVRAEAGFSADRWRVMGIVEVGALVGNLAAVITQPGRIIGLKFFTAPASSTNGSYVFLSDTPGEGVLTPPTGASKVRFIVGILTGANGVTTTPEILFQPAYVARSP